MTATAVNHVNHLQPRPWPSLDKRLKREITNAIRASGGVPVADLRRKLRGRGRLRPYMPPTDSYGFGRPSMFAGGLSIL